MPKQLLSIDPMDDAFPAERLAFIEQQAELLASYAFFGERSRYAELAAQLNTETSKYERGFISGYVLARLNQ